MKWLSRLKSAYPAEVNPTKPTKPGFVGFVGCPPGQPEKSRAVSYAANDAEGFLERDALPEFGAGMSRCGAEHLMSELLTAAMRCCDSHGDGSDAREEMRRQCMEMPPSLRGDLLLFLRRAYPEPNG